MAVKTTVFESLTSVIEVSVLDNFTREKYGEDAPTIMVIESGAYDADPETRIIDGRNWTVMNGTLRREGVAGKASLFSTYHDGRLYLFQLTEVTEVNGTEFSQVNYGDFKRSVLNTEFK